MRRLYTRARAALGAALLAAVAYGCASDSPDITGAAELSLGQQQGLERAMQVQERHTPAVMADADVVGTAVGLDVAGNPVIKVYLARGETRGLPGQLEGFRLVPEVTGPIYALSSMAQGAQARPRAPPVDRTARFPRPVPIGVSTGHPDITAGTIGARVTDGTDFFALSNNHVYANTNAAPLGDNVLQPGPYDGGQDPADAIGTLDDFEPIMFSGGANNVIDAAIALSSTSLLGNATPADGYGTPRATTVGAVPGLRVMKYGRTTGQTKGRVDAVNATVNVDYGTPGVARFVGQVVIVGGGFSAGGDSGSLIVVQSGTDARRPVALLFAGGGGYTIANPINAVLTRFGVTVDGN